MIYSVGWILVQLLFFHLPINSVAQFQKIIGNRRINYQKYNVGNQSDRQNRPKGITISKTKTISCNAKVTKNDTDGISQNGS